MIMFNVVATYLLAISIVLNACEMDSANVYLDIILLIVIWALYLSARHEIDENPPEH